MTSDVSEATGEGRRVSWVELYFDLIFVFAVGQTAHVIVEEPRWAGIGIALGLFVVLWWTWIGYVVLYNRHGEDRPSRRLFVLAGSVPSAVAATELHSAAEGHGAGFYLALAGSRLVLAVAFGLMGARRTSIGYVVSTAALAASAFAPTPARIGLLAFALLEEGSFLLTGSRRQRANGKPANGERANGERPGSGRARMAWQTEAMRAMFLPPRDPRLAVDAAHLAERFGLMMIILLGEIVISLGGAAVDVPAHDAHYWTGLLAGLVLTGALWWIYFDAAAPISEYVLRTSGGNPIMAYTLYAGGHLVPAFALLTTAAGVSLTLHGDHPPPAASWLVTAGVAAYAVGTRAVVTSDRFRFGPLLRLAVPALTVCLALLEPLISATGVVAVTAVWAAALGAFATWRLPIRLRDVAADPLSLFRHRG